LDTRHCGRQQTAQGTIERLQRDDPQGLYEYKVLRSHSFAFASESRLRAELEQEAQAGWEMVAKLDNWRLMLRRQRSQGQADAALPPGVDPYRVTVDTNIPMIAALVILVILVLALLGLMPGMTAVIPVAIAVVGLIALAVAVLVRARQ
jgi:hypothetical protein